LLLLSLAAAQQSRKLDGKWWLSIGADERVEFLAGYIDYYANDFGDKNRTFPESWYTYAPRITRYYTQNPQRVTRQATTVLFDVRSKNPPKPQKGGEVWAEKHWFFNGQYWWQIGAAERTAFIEGYLACYREHLSSRPKRFSESAQTYADEISHWFGAGAPDPSDINPKREDVAIADVLYRFADRQR
jgi:hypothetical protein